MNTGDPTPCGLGNNQSVIRCVKDACALNMTQACIDRMMLDFAPFQNNLVAYCRLERLDGDLSIALSTLCRSVCSRDRDSCRMRREVFCSSRVGSTSDEVRDLCACYWPRRVFLQLIVDTLNSGSFTQSTLAQLASIEDLLRNGINYPYCWNNDCTQSTYGTDTEIVLPCPTIGLCVQAIDVTRATLPPSVTLTNNCTLNSIPVTSTPINPTPAVVWEVNWSWVGALLFGSLVLFTLLVVLAFWKLTPTTEVVQVPIPVRDALIQT